MYCIVEITKYPFTRDYEEYVHAFIQRLQKHDHLDITTGETSTLVRGEYDHVMTVLNAEMKVSFLSG